MIRGVGGVVIINITIKLTLPEVRQRLNAENSICYFT